MVITATNVKYLLEKNLFEGLNNLIDIDLSSNKLKQLDSQLLNQNHLDKLEKINLENNELGSLNFRQNENY